MAPLHLLPEWLPDETLFSLVSRYHRLSGNRLASHTCLELFGHLQQGSQHDFPTRLAHLVEVTDGVLGDARSIIQHRTVLPFYLHFLADGRAESAVRTLEGKCLGGLKFQLGIPTSRFRAHHPLKACPACMGSDSDSHGTPYWHASHQYPGVWICLEHGTPLLESTVKSSGVGRFLWHLPNECTLTSHGQSAVQLDAHGPTALASFAKLSEALSQLPLEATIDAGRLHCLVTSRLKEMDLVNSTGRLRLKAIESAYACAVRPLTSVPELSQLHRPDPNFSSTLGKLLRLPRCGTHPLRHLALIYWLFGTWSQFVELGAKTMEIGTREAPAAKAKPPLRNEPIRLKFLACVKAGTSPTACSKAVGIDVSTGLIWAAQHGLIVRHRRKSISSATITAIAEDLRAGLDKVSVGLRHQVSSASINRILASISGLQNKWRAAKHETARTNARHVWSQALISTPGEGIKQLRKKTPAAFAWLYRNDKAWLTLVNTAVPRSPTKSPKPRVDWLERDRVLAAMVCEAVQQLSAASPDPDRKVNLWEIYQRVPDLKAKLGVLEKMPLTLAVVQSVTTAKITRRHGS